MPHIGKQKCKAPEKCPCPCCLAILSEKTIDRRLGGKYLPTWIKATHAGASSHNYEHPPYKKVCSSNLPSDAFSDISSNVSSNFYSGSSIHSSTTQTGTFESQTVNIDTIHETHETWARTYSDEDNLAQLLHDTWSGQHINYESDSDDESDTDPNDFNKDSLPHPSDTESDLDFGDVREETGMHNSLSLMTMLMKISNGLLVNFVCNPSLIN